MSTTKQPEKCICCDATMLGHEQDDDLSGDMCDECLDEAFAEVDRALSQGGGA